MAQLGALVGNLAYDKRKSGAKGRTIQTDMPTLSLLKHDRLEPTMAYPDVAAVDECRVFPMNLIFGGNLLRPSALTDVHCLVNGLGFYRTPCV